MHLPPLDAGILTRDGGSLTVALHMPSKLRFTVTWILQCLTAIQALSESSVIMGHVVYRHRGCSCNQLEHIKNMKIWTFFLCTNLTILGILPAQLSVFEEKLCQREMQGRSASMMRQDMRLPWAGTLLSCKSSEAQKLKQVAKNQDLDHGVCVWKVHGPWLTWSQNMLFAFICQRLLWWMEGEWNGRVR